MINDNYYVVIDEYSLVIIVVVVIVVMAKNHLLLQWQMIYICRTVIILGTGTGNATSMSL